MLWEKSACFSLSGHKPPQVSKGRMLARAFNLKKRSFHLQIPCWKNVTNLRFITCLEKFQWLVLIYLGTEGSPNSPPSLPILLVQLECVASVQDQHPSLTFCNRTLVLKIIFSELQGFSVADQDVYPGSVFFHPGSRVKQIPDPGSASKNLSILNPKNCF